MIDIEDAVFDAVANVIREQYEGAYVTGEAIVNPPAFPCVTVIEADNSTYERTLDSSAEENHARLMYEINVFSNLGSGKKKQCRAIMALADAEMQRLGFVRVSNSPLEVPNADKTIYRQVARYRTVISKDKKTYRR